MSIQMPDLTQGYCLGDTIQFYDHDPDPDNELKDVRDRLVFVEKINILQHLSSNRPIFVHFQQSINKLL